MDRDIKREIILDNYNNPANKGLKDDKSYILKNTNNDSCIDNIDMMMKIENDKVVDIVFDGEACAICTSATSIIIKTLIGKSVEEVEKIISNYQNMINGEDYDKEVLGDLVIYDDISNQPNRKTCALLPSRAVINILKEYEEK